MPLFIAGVFKDRGQAERVIRSLFDAGIPSSEVSLVVREKAEEDISTRDLLSDEENPFASLAIHSAWERLGWAGGARPAYRDRVPPNIDMAFVAAGPVAIAIGGAQLGACSGGLVGAMNNFGFTPEISRQFYDEVTQGKSWVMVRTTEQEGSKVRGIFTRYQPQLHTESTRMW